MSKEVLTTIQPHCIIAVWDKNFGIKIVDDYPKLKILDKSGISTKVFMAYHYFYKKDGNQAEDRVFFNLEMDNIGKRARILLDFIPNEYNEGDIEPFVVILLFPNFFPEKALENFDNIIHNMGLEFIETRNVSLEKYYDKILEDYTLEQKVQDADLSLKEDYNIQDALLDFKNGLEQFQKKEFNRSYVLIRKAHAKFELEGQTKLLIETTYIIGTSLAQNRKYEAALEYYLKLRDLAVQIEHKKYSELSLFMSGFCSYNLADNLSTIQYFNQLKQLEMLFTSKFQFHTLYGRTLNNLKMHAQAIVSLQKALEISISQQSSEDLKKKQANILMEIGYINYKMTYEMVNKGDINDTTYSSYLQNSINSFIESSKLWFEIQNYNGIFHSEQLIANIYELKNDLDHAHEHYQIALKATEESNDVINRFKIHNQIIQIYRKQERHDLIAKELDRILHESVSIAFVDLFTIAGFHMQLGESLIILGKGKIALSELLIALNIYKKLPKPFQDVIIVLEKIVQIYKNKNELEHVQYYEGELTNFKEKLEKTLLEEKYLPMEVIKDIWIFTEQGECIFAYLQEMEADPQLVGGFLSAMQSFGAELKMETIKTIKFGRNIYAYYKEPDLPFFVVGRTLTKFQVSLVEKLLKAITESFWTEFKPYLEKYEGDSLIFNQYQEVLKNLDYSE